MNWFKNLKKWQKGGLIGLGIGLIFAAIMLISPPLEYIDIHYGNGHWENG